MMTDSQRVMMKRHGTLVARIFIGALFIMAGIGKLGTVEGTAGFIASAGLPAPELLTYLTIIVEIVGGAALVLGWHFGYAAAALVLFTGLASIIFHGPGSWENQLQQTMFMKNLAIIGGLLYMLAHGPGDGWALGKRHSGGGAPQGGV